MYTKFIKTFGNLMYECILKFVLAYVHETVMAFTGYNHSEVLGLGLVS